MNRPIIMSCAAVSKRNESISGPNLLEGAAVAQGRGKGQERHSGHLGEKLL